VARATRARAEYGMSERDVLIVGGGGREHALAWKLRQSRDCGALYAAPGNAGMADLAACRAVPATDIDALVNLALDLHVDLVVIGPEAPLAAGLADRLEHAGVPVFGPSQGAARIESSKSFARNLMSRKNVPQPRYVVFQEAEPALDFLRELERGGATGAVVKAGGLAAGKGAMVCPEIDLARTAVRRVLVDREFGEAGAEVIIEELLVGEEASLFVITDGSTALPMLPAQDYKRALDGDHGPNTGGMGAFAPAPVLTPDLVEEAMSRIVRPTLEGLTEDGCPFRGCLYAGLMNTAAGLQVIEFNCRFGDPEAQVVLPLLETDLLDLFGAVSEGALSDRPLEWAPLRAVTVVLASGGYPDAYETGKRITGIEEAQLPKDVLLFHAGTARSDRVVVTAGGRVLNVTGLGDTFERARTHAYAAAEQIQFEGRQYRTDIAAGVSGR
jgi:phosphoribosylamine---glycine ligase